MTFLHRSTDFEARQQPALPVPQFRRLPVVPRAPSIEQRPPQPPVQGDPTSGGLYAGPPSTGPAGIAPYGGAYTPMPDWSPSDGNAPSQGQILGDLQAQQLIEAGHQQRMASIEQDEASRPDPMEEAIKAHQKMATYEQTLPMEYDEAGNPVFPKSGGSITVGGSPRRLPLGKASLIEKALGGPMVGQEREASIERGRGQSKRLSFADAQEAHQKAMEKIQAMPDDDPRVDKKALIKEAHLRWLASLTALDPSFKDVFREFATDRPPTAEEVFARGQTKPIE